MNNVADSMPATNDDADAMLQLGDYYNKISDYPNIIRWRLPEAIQRQ